MTTFDYIQAAFALLLAVFAWLLVCIAIWGAPKTSKRQAEELADQADALKMMRSATEDDHITELELRLPILRAALDKMRREWPANASTPERVELRLRIYDDERMLAMLTTRKEAYPNDRRETMATVTEGRM